MSGPYLSANSVRVTTLDLAFPYLGVPVADITLATGAGLASPVTLVVGNLTVKLAVMLDPATGAPRVRNFAGQTHARLVGGAGSWPTRVSLAPYSRPSGVLLSTVLSDLANATGTTAATRERVRLAAGLDRSLGIRYVTEQGAPAGRLLALLAGALWWVDVNGVTQVAATRPTSVIKTQTAVEKYDAGRGLLTVATEDVRAWQPGAVYTSPTVPAGVTVNASRVVSDADGKLRVEALVS